jgi:tRNA1(Val) A37 N6-methylase TrmN6
VAQRLTAQAGETLDFLCGHWRIFQAERGHRYSVDDVLCAQMAVCSAPRVERHLDLGSGIGSVALFVAWRLPGAQTTTIEAQALSAALQRRSVAYNGAADRFRIIEGDLRDAHTLDEAAAGGLFDLVTGTPPYWPVGSALPAQHSQAIPARLEVRGDILDYARAARRCLKPGGVFVCVHQGSQLERVLDALGQAELAVVRLRPVRFKEKTPVSDSGLHLYACHRREDVPHTMHRPFMEPDLIIRASDGQTHPMYAAWRLSFGFPPGNVAASEAGERP